MSKQAYRQVVVGTDFSEEAERAVEAAARVAKRWDAQVTLVHVYEPAPFYQGIFSSSSEELEAKIASAAKEELDAIAARFLAGVSVELSAIAGRSAAAAFCKEAERRKADLCIVGTHGRAGAERLFIGSVAEKIVRHAPCDVLTVPPDAHGQVPFAERILIATDFSESSTRAAAAAPLLAASSSELLVVHVFDDSIPVPAPDGGFERTEQTSARHTRELELWRSRALDEKLVVVTEVIADGNAALALTQRASQWKAELIVIGSHGRGGVSKLLIGSVSERTTRHAPCPVLCVRS